MQSCARTSENRRGEVCHEPGGNCRRRNHAGAGRDRHSRSSRRAAAPPPPDFSKVEIKTTDLGDNVYMLEGQGGNITVAVAKDGIIMVDGQFAPLHDKIKAAIAAISNLPIKYLINTHYHGDHTGGNEPFAKDGVTVVAQDQRQEAARGRHHQWPDRRQDAAGAAGRAAGRHLYRTFPRSGSTAASPTSSTSPTRIPTATPMSGSRPPTCCRPATPSPTAAIPTSISPMAATSRA